ncbi:hypothetical protein [uncultured Gammaproteobacteria bacterium]|nr:hypothetical protein [uncultured Gammaproteobacteria bacterium]
MDEEVKISTETPYRFVLQNKAVGGYFINTFATSTRSIANAMASMITEVSTSLS